MAPLDPSFDELDARPVAGRHGSGINFKRMLRLRGRTMLVICLAILIPAAVAIFFFVPRQYVAVSTVEYKATTPRIQGEDRDMSGTAAYENFVNTQIELVTGYTIPNRALNNPALATREGLGDRADGVQFLQRNLRANVQDQLGLVEYSFRHPDRETALIVMNTILEEYRAYLREQVEEQGEVRRQVLLSTQEELRAQLEEYRDQLTAMRSRAGIALGDQGQFVPAETESYRINLANAEADITRAETQLRESQKLVERVQQYLEEHESSPTRPIYALGVEEKVNQDPQVALLAEQLSLVQQQHAALSETYVDDAPQLKVKRSELEGVEAKLAEVKARARTTALRSLLAQYEFDMGTNESNIVEAQARRDRFLALLREFDQQRATQSQELAQLADLERQAQNTQQRLENIDTQLLDLSIESNAPARVEIVEGAIAPPTPDRRLQLQFLLMAVLGSLTAAFGVGVVMELMDQSIRSAEDVAYVSDLPVLASIPHAQEDRLPPDVDVSTISANYPASMTADEYRRAVARILYSGRIRGETKSCVIASAARGDGKSTLSCNLAIVLAQAERRVLLVDVDSRNPSIERYFGLTPSQGLGEMLSGEPLEHDPDRSTEYKNLFVLGPGLHSGDLLERIASREMADFLQGAEELFDHVIIDTPASLLMSEARLLAPLVDGVVLVAGAGVTNFGMFRRALRTIADSGGNVLGVVVNSVRYSPGGYLRRNLEQYYAQRGHVREPGPAIPRPRRRKEQPSIILVDEDSRGGSPR